MIGKKVSYPFFPTFYYLNERNLRRNEERERKKGKKEKKIGRILFNERKRNAEEMRQSSLEDGRLVDSFAKVCAYRSCMP